jgi:hypothetical protein
VNIARRCFVGLLSLLTLAGSPSAVAMGPVPVEIQAADQSYLFGWSQAASGNTLVVGAPSGSQSPGSAFVFTKEHARWVQVAVLTASDGANFEGFGSSVGVSGNTVVVGAPEHAVGANAHLRLNCTALLRALCGCPSRPLRLKALCSRAS